MNVDNEYVTIEGAANILHVHYNTIYRWVTIGKLPAAQLSDIWRIKRTDIEEFFNSHKKLPVAD